VVTHRGLKQTSEASLPPPGAVTICSLPCKKKAARPWEGRRLWQVSFHDWEGTNSTVAATLPELRLQRNGP
jgi:hypothetical protein